MKKLVLLLVLLSFFRVEAQTSYKQYEYSIDFSQEDKPYSNYWNATGFTPGEMLLRKDMQLTLDYISAVPNDGYLYIRPHWMLNMVGSRNAGTDEVTYNFEKLGMAFDAMVDRGLKPIFEIMGFPSTSWEPGSGKYDGAAQSQKNQDLQWIPDFETEDGYTQWYAFVREMILFLENRYGRQELKTWYFESTNEPDVHQHFWSYGIPALLNYWDATSEAIKSVDENYIFGGPGTARGLSDELKAVLAHCDNGQNVITGERGAVLDYISIHRKFSPYTMIDKEMELVEYIRENHPRFSKLPFWNNEADPMAGWSRSYWWRAHPWYAAFVAQSVDAHNRLAVDSAAVPFSLLLNDNGFMGTWYQRTQMARFMHTDDPGKQSQFWLLKKPVFSVFSLLSMSRGERYEVKGYESTRESVVVIPSKTKAEEIVLILANKPDFGPVHNNWKNNKNITLEQKFLHDLNGALVSVNLEGLKVENLTLKHFRLDGLHGYAHGAWESLGAPDTLSADIYRMLAAHMEPMLIGERDLLSSVLHVVLPPSSVSMVVISPKKQKQEFPNPDITRIIDYQGFNGEKKKFVQWEQAGDQFVRYNVLASYEGKPYQVVNANPLIDLGFLDVLPEDISEVEYKIEVVP